MEEERYNETFNYLKFGTYPDGADKVKRKDIRTKAAPFLIQEDQLYHVPRTGIDDCPKEVVLARDKKRVIKECHISESGRHYGKNRTVEVIVEKYYWKGMKEDVAKYCAVCEQCKRNPNDAPGPGRPSKLTGTGAGTAMMSTTKVNKSSSELDPVGVWKLVGMDLMGPFPKTIRGNQFVCGLTDSFSEWPVVEPMAYKTVSDVAIVLIRVICNYGCFTTLITDQDQEYVTHLNFIICEKLSIDHEIASAYHPQTSGLQVRCGLQKHFNPKLEHCIAKFVNENPHDWDLRLNEVLFPYRTNRHENTGLTPFYVMFGREPVLPADFNK